MNSATLNWKLDEQPRSTLADSLRRLAVPRSRLRQNIDCTFQEKIMKLGQSLCLSVVIVYAPTNYADHEVKDNFYHHLS